MSVKFERPQDRARFLKLAAATATNRDSEDQLLSALKENQNRAFTDSGGNIQYGTSQGTFTYEDLPQFVEAAVSTHRRLDSELG